VTYYYFDSSVLVKAYVTEPGADSVRDVLRRTRAVEPTARVIVSILAHTEVASVVSRREAAGELSRKQATLLMRRLKQDFLGDRRPYEIIGVTDGIASHAPVLTRTHRLRTNDAVQLATGLAARTATPDGIKFVFATTDDALYEAARAEGFVMLDLTAPAGG